jgi:ABC-type antimicrobial peptide transport system permease subunit
MRKGGLAENLFVTIIASLILIALGMIYLVVVLFIVKFSTSLMGFVPDPDIIVLSSSIIVAGIMIGSAIKNG